MSEIPQWNTGLVELGDGVFAYVQAKGTAGISNAGLILGDDYAVIIDTLGTRPMHDNFIASIRRVTKLPIGAVVITHHHIDHILGIHRFLPTRVICHASARPGITSRGPNAVEEWGERRPQFAEDLVGVELAVPDVTFEDRLTLHLGRREVVCVYPGAGHTTGDIYVHLPDDDILFAGDLFFNFVCPAGFQGHVGHWIEVVDELRALAPTVVVPGHGPVSDCDGLADMQRFLRLIHRGARECFDRGITAAEAAAELQVGDFRKWGDADERLPENIARIFAEFRGELADIGPTI